jgi:hypothetical protein
MPENAGARVDTHVYPHVSELTEEELEANRQAEEAKGKERNKQKGEEERAPAPILENPGRSVSFLKRCQWWKKRSLTK